MSADSKPHSELRSRAEEFAEHLLRDLTDAENRIVELELACDHHRMFWQKAEERERGLLEQYESLRAANAETEQRLDEEIVENGRLEEQFEALAKVILGADEHTQQPIDLNYIAIFKDDWHRIVGKVTPPAKLADLFVSNPANQPDVSERAEMNEAEPHPPAGVPQTATRLAARSETSAAELERSLALELMTEAQRVEFYRIVAERETQSPEAGIRGWIEDKQMRRNP